MVGEDVLGDMVGEDVLGDMVGEAVVGDIEGPSEGLIDSPHSSYANVLHDLSSCPPRRVLAARERADLDAQAAILTASPNASLTHLATTPALSVAMLVPAFEQATILAVSPAASAIHLAISPPPPPPPPVVFAKASLHIVSMRSSMLGAFVVGAAVVMVGAAVE